MEAALQPGRVSGSAPGVSVGPVRSLRTFYFAIEGINAVATSYYFNYLFFYMRDHFGFGNRNNLMLTALHGLLYTFSAWNAGRFGQKHGYRFCLRLGFSGMCVALTVGAFLPRALGFSRAGLIAEFCSLCCWTLSMCLTWPTLQALVSQRQTPAQMPRTAGLYNIVWASGAALANMTGGALRQWFGGEVLFLIPAGLHLTQLVMIAMWPEAGTVEAAAPTEDVQTAEIPELNPRPIAKARTFLYLAWFANPLAYVAINSALPVMPKLAANLKLDDAHAGLFCSVWFWVRIAAFITFWLWTGWHYRFRWLLAAFLSLSGSFALMLLSSQLWMLVAAQVVFGLAVGLIYYSSLFYSMDVGASRGKKGGIHEAAIGLGVFSGPAIGMSALSLFPSFPNAGIWATSGVLVLGLVPFLMIRRRGRSGC